MTAGGAAAAGGDTAFEADDAPPRRAGDGTFFVDLDGFEGPLDLLLALARQQKVDLTSISVLALAEQYLAYIAEAHRLRIEVAADYLVMAAWLAYLKSRLLLPEPEPDEEPSAAEMAERLRLRLERLAAIRRAADLLFRRPRLGLEVFARGRTEDVAAVVVPVWECALIDLLRAYGRQVRRDEALAFRPRPRQAYSIEEARRRLEAVLGRLPDWATLEAFLPEGLETAFDRRSALASTLVATLELVRSGQVQMRQGQPFGPIMVKGKPPE